MSDTAPSKPRSRLRRVTVFTLKSIAVLVAGLALYISIPAVRNADRLTKGLSSPQAQELLNGMGISGSDLRDMKMGAYVPSFALQGLATLGSAIVGLSVQTESGDTWAMSDSALDIFAQPGPGKFALMTTGCYDGVRMTSLMAYRGQGSHLAQETKDRQAEALDRDPNGVVFQPMTPWITKELYDLNEMDSKVLLAIHKQPKPLWHFPYFGPFKDSRDRRADVVKVFPELGTIDCSQDRSKAMTITESLANLAEAEGAPRGAGPEPFVVELGGPPTVINLAGLPKGLVKVEPGPYGGSAVISVSWPRQGKDWPASVSRGYERLNAALRSQGPLQQAIRMHLDSGTAAGKSTVRHAYQLLDGIVSVSRGYNNGQAELHLSWAPEAPAEPEPGAMMSLPSLPDDMKGRPRGLPLPPGMRANTPE